MRKILILALVVSLFAIPITLAAGKTSHEGEPTDPESAEPTGETSGEPTDPDSVDEVLEWLSWAIVTIPATGITSVAQN